MTGGDVAVAQPQHAAHATLLCDCDGQQQQHGAVTMMWYVGDS